MSILLAQPATCSWPVTLSMPRRWVHTPRAQQQLHRAYAAVERQERYTTGLGLDPIAR